MIANKRIWLCFALIGLVAIASAQVSKVGSSYLFRQKFVAGGKIKYITVISQSMGAQGGISMMMPFSQRIKSVAKGIASLSVTVGPAALNGKSMGKSTSYDMKVNALGQVVGGPQGGAQGVTAFPPKPIRFGQTWTATVPAPGMGGETSTATATYKFLKMGSLNGKSAAIVSVNLSSTGQFSLSGTGISYLSAADGSLLKNSMSLSATSPMTQGQPITVKVLVTRG